MHTVPGMTKHCRKEFLSLNQAVQQGDIKLHAGCPHCYQQHAVVRVTAQRKVDQMPR